MSNDPAANLERMYSYLDDARDADGPGHVVVDGMMLSDWCSALARAIGEADGSTLAGQQDAIALLRAEIERLTRTMDALGVRADSYAAKWEAEHNRAAAAEAEAARLREALNVDPWSVGFAHWKALRARALGGQP